LQSQIAWFDRDQAHLRQFNTGVSIHSHTSCSKESLEFVGRILDSHPVLRAFIRSQDRKVRKGGLAIDLSRAYWTPPVCPRSAYELEKNQIEQKLGKQAMVSITDHDCIDAPLLLRVVPAMEGVPISLEWTVPFQSSKFHLGVHNLPAARAGELMDELKSCTAEPSTERVCDMLRTLHAIPEVLVVFNHPLWNLYANTPAEFAQNLEDFLALNNGHIHAFELNGTRSWEENRRVAKLAAQWQQLPISGGDRHSFEPNANLNLTNASNFAEWVHELRIERASQMLFMPQYNESRVARFYEVFLDAIRENPYHPDGAIRWDQRTYHPGRNGEVQPISALWDHVPRFLQLILGTARLAETTHLLNSLRGLGGEPSGNATGITGQEEGA
jgi:hypothetical protein